MSTKKGKRVTRKEVQRVKIMIEQCLLRYMTREEVMDILYLYQKIEPSFTNIVWKRLEEENEEYFKAYYPRLILCKQIKRFNHLLEKEAAVIIMDQLKHGDEVAMSNGAHMQQMHQVQHPVSTFNSGPSQHSGMQYTYNTSAFDHSSNLLLDQNPNQVAYPPESHIPQTRIPNSGIPPVFDYPYNTMWVQNTDGGVLLGMHNGINPTDEIPTYFVPTDLLDPGCANCGLLMEPAYGDPFNTLLAQNPNVGMMQGMNNEMIPVNNNTITSLGNYGHQIGNSGVQLQAPLHQLSIPLPPPFSNEPYSPGDQHSTNG